MKEAMVTNWNFFRFLRLGIGIAIIVQAVMAKDMLFGIAGLLFTGMAVFNIGCCGMGKCNTSNIPQKKISETTNDISYEEVV
jgi:NO-binding membrane sensor protein with MHYT domain